MGDRKNQIEDLVTDLLYLRKGSGFTASRAYEASTFVSVIGGKNQVFENIKIRFTSAIQSLPDKQSAESLLAAYALLPEYEGIALLKDRRIKYGKQVKRKYDTLADREAMAINEMAIRLLNAYYSGAPLEAGLPLPHGGMLIESLSVKTVIKDKSFISHEQSRTIIPLVEGAKAFDYHSNERTEIIPIEGVTVETRYVANGSIHRLQFSEPLKRGRTFKFRYIERSLEVNKAILKNEDFAGQSFETPALKYTQEVVFEGDKPSVIWSYDKMSRIERPGEPANNKQLRIDKDGVIKREFTQLYGGLHSGIAWRWK